jgi:predicted RNase H-like HicB family nuclease
LEVVALLCRQTYNVIGEAHLNIKVVLEPSKDGGYTVYTPSLPGCISEGETEEEALTNIKEAIELYLEPVDDELFITDSHMVKEVAI